VFTESALFKPLPTKRAFEEISEQIKDLIFSGTLKPGDKLPPERELAVQFRAGRMAVREALRVLEQSRLIYIKQGSEGGAFVKEVDASGVFASMSDVIRRANVRIEDLTEVRIGVEKLVVEAAIERITESGLEALKKSIDEAEAVLGEGLEGGAPVDFKLLAVTNVDFHIELARATKNPLYEIIVECLMNATTDNFFSQMVPPNEFLGNHLAYHKAIYEAVKSRDVVLARKKLEEHSRRIESNFFNLSLYRTRLCMGSENAREGRG
jgi:GntR family transcriptional regulator, transcriptional repressor for pyruvate dehydrogenase complex